MDQLIFLGLIIIPGILVAATGVGAGLLGATVIFFASIARMKWSA